jgi:hypothetical protein
MLERRVKSVPRRTARKIIIIFWLAVASDFVTSAVFIRSGYGSFEANPYQRAFVEKPSLETFLPWLMDFAACYWFLIGASGIILYRFYNVKTESKKTELLSLSLKIALPTAMLAMACYRLLIGTASNTWLILYKMLGIEICPIIIQLFLLVIFIILPLKREFTEGMNNLFKQIHNTSRKTKLEDDRN